MWQIPPLRKNNIRYMWQTYYAKRHLGSKFYPL